MGCGSWTPHDWDSYSKSSIAGKSAAGIYTSKMMKAEFDPKDIPVRESRDSADHPSSNAIIIGLDVTGSMSDILEGVAKKLNVLVSEILDRKPVTDPQIMFNAIGDAMCDTTPFQATQFESDIRIAEQLTQLYFERGGGGNGFESYPLAWYFAAMHTDIDCLNKRNQKGFLFTMGDDCYSTKLTAREIKQIFGDTVERDIPVDELREHIQEIPKDKPVYVICQSGLRSYIACRILSGYGFTCFNFSGGFRLYSSVMHDRRLAETASVCGMD